MERPYEKLIAWQKSYALCLYIYSLVRKFPSYERFGLCSQMRRSASSTPVNIAEGNAKRTAKDKANFLDIALGSLEELHCEARLAKDLEYMTVADYDNINIRVHKVSYLINRLRSPLVSV